MARSPTPIRLLLSWQRHVHSLRRLVRDGLVLLGPKFFHLGPRGRRNYSLDTPKVHGRLVDVDFPVEPAILDERRQLLLDDGHAQRPLLGGVQLAGEVIDTDSN